MIVNARPSDKRAGLRAEFRNVNYVLLLSLLDLGRNLHLSLRTLLKVKSHHHIKYAIPRGHFDNVSTQFMIDKWTDAEK